MDVCLFLMWAVASLRSRIGKSLGFADGQPFKEFVVCLRAALLPCLAGEEIQRQSSKSAVISEH